MSNSKQSEYQGLLGSEVWPLIVLPLLLLLITLFFTWDDIETQVAHNANKQLQTNHAWAKADAYNRGREVLLQGIAPNEAAVDDAVKVAGSAEGVNSVTFVGEIAPVKIIMRPSKIDLKIDQEQIQLSGTVDSEESIQTLLSQARRAFSPTKITHQLTIAEHTTSPPNIDSIISALRQIPEQGGAKLEGDNLILTGVVSSAETKNKIEQVARQRFSGDIDNQIEIVAPPCQIAVNKMLSETKINFAFGKATIEPSSEAILKQVVAAVDDCPAAEFEITGHTDDVGDEEANLDLSLERANAVVAWLGKLGLDEARFKTRGAGAKEPIASNEQAAGRADNRRIEFRVTN